MFSLDELIHIAKGFQRTDDDGSVPRRAQNKADKSQEMRVSKRGIQVKLAKESLCSSSLSVQ